MRTLVTYVSPILGADALVDLLAAIDTTYFHPHPMTLDEAERIVAHSGQDVYLAHETAGRLVAYGMLRGWDEGYAIPSLGVAVRTDSYRQGHGRRMMDALRDVAIERGAPSIRLRVHPHNAAAVVLYRSLGYERVGEERGEDLMTLDL